MHRNPDSRDSALFDRAERHVKLFQQDVEAEPWKALHDEVMKCYAFEDTLKGGVALYDSFVELDELLRTCLVKHAKRTPEETTDLLAKMHSLFAYWLKPCERVEKELQRLEKAGFEPVAHAAAFRRCHAEAKWIVAEAGSLNHPKLVEARDAAIDECRSGNGN